MAFRWRAGQCAYGRIPVHRLSEPMYKPARRQGLGSVKLQTDSDLSLQDFDLPPQEQYFDSQNFNAPNNTSQNTTHTRPHNSKYYLTVSYLMHAVLVTSIAVVWILTLLYFSNPDSVALYTLDWALPNPQVSYTPTYPTSQITYDAEMSMMGFCLTPDLYSALYAGQSNINKQYTANPSVATNALTNLVGANDTWVTPAVINWNNLFISSWNPNSYLTLQYDGTGGTNQPPLLPSQHFSPACRCIYTVLQKYKKLNTTAYTDRANNVAITQNAVQACLGTVQNIPRQRLVGVSDLSTTGDIPSTKSISRVTLLLIMGLAMLMGLVYRMWIPYVSVDYVHLKKVEEFDQFDQLEQFGPKKPTPAPERKNDPNISTWLASIFLYVLMVLIPLAAARGVNVGNGAAFYCILLLPGGFLLFVVELSWYFSTELTNHRRFVYMHPFVFFVTLTTMYMLALVENGVYTLDNYLTYYFVGVAISIVYAIAIQCAHAKVFDNSSTNMIGFVLFLFVAGLAGGYHQNPYFPTNQGLNFLWSLPVWFCVIFFATIVFLERLFKEDQDLKKNEGEALAFTQSGHILQLAHYAFVVVYLIYFLSVIFFQVEGGSALLSNANRLFNRVNFDLLEDATPQYIKASPWGRYVNF